VIRKEILLIGNIIILIASLLLVSQGTVVAQRITPDERMILIKGSWDKGEVKTQIDPIELTVDRGTRVTWINQSQSEVKIKFGEGTNCEEVDSKAIGWRLNRNINPNKCFVTRDSIRSNGGTMSVLFTETVQYKYEVEYVSKDRREEGIIKARSGPGG
jgi:plastocyanin